MDHEITSSSKGKAKSKKVLFLGYDNFHTSLVDFLEMHDYEVKIWGEKLTGVAVEDFDIIISFGYRYIIKKDILERVKRDIINLHIAYLPYNKGAYPNFWSFYDDTPKGVTIHLIDEGVDTGPIIARKEIIFDKSHDSFDKTYQVLVRSIEELFIEFWPQIENQSFKPFIAEGEGSFHYRKELPKLPLGWHANIKEALKALGKSET